MRSLVKLILNLHNNENILSAFEMRTFLTGLKKSSTKFKKF